jgi:hypothetical protein
MKFNGIYTTTLYQGKWLVLLLQQPDGKEAQQISISFTSEDEAKAFMQANEPQMSFATDKAFMMALQAQRMMNR